MNKKIDPKQLIKELSVEELCQTAEEYFRNLPNPMRSIAKPFENMLETPQILYKMGLLLYGLRLGKSMVILDFGAGTCWFSRFLNQMQCVTISVDASETALELGKKLFEISPIVGEYLHPPRFVHFDGRHIEIDDETVDRIISFDAFHHVPNQRQVLQEFFRVLKPGGIVGFSEPGMHHSQTAHSQYEMQRHTVLENDIRLDEINEIATDIGFSAPYVKLLYDPHLNLDYADYEKIVKLPTIPATRQELITEPRRSLRAIIQRIFQQKSSGSEFPSKVIRNIVPAMQNSVVFFLTKGTFIPDSRSHLGLKHKLELLTKTNTVPVGAAIEFKVRLKNVGSSKWLHSNLQDIGVVKLGVHLLDANQQLLENDFARGRLQADVMPGQTVTAKVSVTCAEAGEYILSFDLVSEHVIWFQILGSRPQYLRVNVI